MATIAPIDSRAGRMRLFGLADRVVGSCRRLSRRRFSSVSAAVVAAAAADATGLAVAALVAAAAAVLDLARAGRGDRSACRNVWNTRAGNRSSDALSHLLLMRLFAATAAALRSTNSGDSVANTVEAATGVLLLADIFIDLALLLFRAV